MKKIVLLAAVVVLALMTVASASPTAAVPPPEAASPTTDPTVDVAVLTGRWRLFFGTRICWGQIVNLPGESQCV